MRHAAIVLIAVVSAMGCATDADDDGVPLEPNAEVSIEGPEVCPPFTSVTWIDYWVVGGASSLEDGGIFATGDEDFCDHYWAWAVHKQEYQARKEEAIAADDGPAACQAEVEYLTAIHDLHLLMYPIGTCGLAVEPDRFSEDVYCANYGLYATLVYVTCDFIGIYLDGLNGCEGVVDWSTWADLSNAAVEPASECRDIWRVSDGHVEIWELEDDFIFAAGHGLVIDQQDDDGEGTLDLSLVASPCTNPG